MSRTLKPSRDDISRVACAVLVGVSWAMVVANAVINVRNGQRLSIDDYGWALNSKRRTDRRAGLYRLSVAPGRQAPDWGYPTGLPKLVVCQRLRGRPDARQV